MELEKNYFDSEGNPCTLYRLVRDEPDWAESRIRTGEKLERTHKELERTHKELERKATRLLVIATKWCDKNHHDWKELLKIAGID